MGLANLAHAIFYFHKKEKAKEGLIQNDSISLEVGLNTVSPKIKHIVFIVSYLEIRRIPDMKHLLLRVGMVGIGKKD